MFILPDSENTGFCCIWDYSLKCILVVVNLSMGSGSRIMLYFEAGKKGENVEDTWKSQGIFPRYLECGSPVDYFYLKHL